MHIFCHELQNGYHWYHISICEPVLRSSDMCSGCKVPVLLQRALYFKCLQGSARFILQDVRIKAYQNYQKKGGFWMLLDSLAYQVRHSSDVQTDQFKHAVEGPRQKLPLALQQGTKGLSPEPKWKPIARA